MLNNRVYRLDQAHRFPADVHAVVSELFQSDRASAEIQIWRDLKNKEGAVWHRQSDPELHALSQHLTRLSGQLRHRQDSYAFVSNDAGADEALKQSVRESQLVTEGLLTPEQTLHLEREFRCMYDLMTRLTGEPTAVIDLRIERTMGFIENFHQDLGTALLMSLVGPGPHFIKPDNQPADHRNAFFREEIPRPNEVFEVPTCSLLAMRGKPESDHAREPSPSGLWHSSPPKVWDGTPQWDTRVLLIVTSPKSEILPAPPIVTL